jgi:glycosyltransferase involved in cell wall biosynthesis
VDRIHRAVRCGRERTRTRPAHYPDLESHRDSDTLTVVIPTKDRAGELARCLESVTWADEIIVVDMFSTDDTPEVCSRHPQCRLITRNDYIFGNVNHGFDQATSDWVMRLDTDERITSELAVEIQAILAAPPAGITGFEFWERPINLGKELRHGFGRRHYRQMMFRRGTARYPVEREHEALVSRGRWARLRHGYLHENYRSVGHYLQKMDYYTDRDGERMPLRDEPPRQRDALVDTARIFYLYYLKYRGYRDGWVGLVDAGMRAIYQFVQWAKLRRRWELERAGATVPQDGL